MISKFSKFCLIRHLKLSSRHRFQAFNNEFDNFSNVCLLLLLFFRTPFYGMFPAVDSPAEDFSKLKNKLFKLFSRFAKSMNYAAHHGRFTSTGKCMSDATYKGVRKEFDSNSFVCFPACEAFEKRFARGSLWKFNFFFRSEIALF